MVEFLQDWGGLILSGISVIIAVISIIQSFKAQKLQNKINELDTKIKEYEVGKIEREKTEALSSIINARAVNVGKNSYRLKIYNAGNTMAYNVAAQIISENSVILLSDKMPFEELKPQDGFEVPIIIYSSNRKFRVELTWQDKDGTEHKDEQLCSI